MLNLARPVPHASPLRSHGTDRPQPPPPPRPQVGRDARAQAFLGRLDRDPSVGDIIDCTSYFEQEAEEYARKGVNLSVEAWLLKLMVGAVDPSYDAEDEG